MFSDLLATALRSTKPVGGKGSSAQRAPGVLNDAVEPHAEHVAGPVFAYRGQEQHGVSVTDGSHYVDPSEAFRTTVDAEVLPENHPPTPILVKSVQEDGNEVRKFRNVSLLADISQRMIVSRMTTRTSVKLYNLSQTVTVLLGNDSSVSPTSGYPLGPGREIEIKATDEIWAVSFDGSPVDIRGLIEYRQG